MPQWHRSVLSALRHARSSGAAPASALTGTVIALGLAVGTVVAAAPARAAAPSYVALGDSYSSGVGTRTYISDGTACQRSTYAYPSLVAAAKGYSLNFRACSGATVADVTNTQLGALSGSTSYVTISVGGNDAGFADVVTECALPAWASDCAGRVSTAQAFIRGTLPARLSTLYASIRAEAPNATVVVVGYPRLFMGEDCNALTWFSPADEQILNDTAVLLDGVLSSAASAKGFAFVNPVSRFTGHAVCDSVEWLNGLSSPASESYHPNRAGQARGYTPLVSPLLTGSTALVSSRTLRAAAASADRLAAAQAPYAAQDASIVPERFEAPDLTTPEARAAARRAGLDVDRWLGRHR